MNKYIFFLIIPLLCFGVVQNASALTWVDIPATIDYVEKLTSGSSFCNTTYTKYTNNGTHFEIQRPPSSGSGTPCIVTSFTFDVSDIPNGATITDTDLKFTINTVTNGINCDYNPMVVEPATASASDLYGDITNGTAYVDNDSGCTTTGAKTIDLGTTADSDLDAKVLSDDNFSVGFTYDSLIRDASLHQVMGTNPVLAVSYTFTAPDPPTLPSGSQSTITWGTPEGNGASPDDVKIEYSSDGSSWVTVTTVPVATGTYTHSNGDPEQYSFSSDSDPRFRLSVNNTNGFSEYQQVFNSTVASNLNSYWPLKSTLNDNGAEDNDGVITAGTEIYSSTGEYFDGSTYNTIPVGAEADYDFIDRTTGWTVAFSMSTTDTTAATRLLLSKTSAFGGAAGFAVYLSSGGALLMDLENTVTTNDLRINANVGTITDGTERRFVVTKAAGTGDDSEVKWYKDGVVTPYTTSLDTLTGDPKNNAAFVLGAQSGGGNKFKGSIGDVIVSDVTWDSHQVAQDYQNYIDHLVRPQNVTDLDIDAISLSTATLGWTAPETYEETLLGYQINYTTPYGAPATILLNNTGTDDVSYSVSGLTFATPYSFRVQAWSSGGNSYGSGNIANGTTTGADYAIGNLTIPTDSNPNTTPFQWTRTEVNGTTTLLALTYPSTYDPEVTIASRFANTDTTYTNLNYTDLGDGTYQALFYFYGATNDLITATATDDTTDDTSTYQLTWTQFPLLDQLNGFRDGTYGTQGMFGAVDLITLGVIILSMIGFNRVNAAAGAIFSIIIIGALSYFGIITWPGAVAAGLAALVLLAVSSHHKEES